RFGILTLSIVICLSFVICFLGFVFMLGAGFKPRKSQPSNPNFQTNSKFQWLNLKQGQRPAEVWNFLFEYCRWFVFCYLFFGICFHSGFWVRAA
ncbi:MAG: hypothetical protein KFF68_17050, partial [Desulfosarcina sp.]|nr:hypothetical protein [Desulfosarcina sp.]